MDKSSINNKKIRTITTTEIATTVQQQQQERKSYRNSNDTRNYTAITAASAVGAKIFT
jgi:hypothetical protein